MSRKAFHKKNRARTWSEDLQNVPESLPQKKTAPGPCWEDLQNVPESLPQREPETRARTLLGGPSKCPGKLATKRTREPCQDLAGRTFKMSRNACHKEDRARNLLGEPTKCPGKLATKGTVPGTC